ncbi:MAG TPA: IS4 family transposase [Methylocystis sp.]|nr:IS4 family transposase [Methylocystis sp.]HXZ14667.1 IS4 family transposase [Roseiarcus sp.]
MCERLVAHGGKGVSVRGLGGDRAGEMRITRFLRNPKVTVGRMMATARARSCAAVAGRPVLAVQDTSALRVDEKGLGLSFHPVIAVDAHAGTMLGLVDTIFLTRQGGERGKRKQKAFEEKDSRRWLDGARAASALAEAGAACVTVIEDREGDIYECFALKPANVEKLVRAAQDRRLADGTSLFSKADAWEEAGRMTVELAAAPGRAARKAELSVNFGKVEILRPSRHSAASGLPKTIGVTLVVGREINPPDGEEPALWLLLTTHRVNDVADARRIIGFYRLRWTIEHVFRTMKTKGFAVEALRQEEDGPLEKLVTAILIAAIKVMQLVAEREGKAQRPLGDVFDPDDRPALERVCQSLEGKTAKQKNPHPAGSLAYAAWVFARLGGWTGYYGKPGPIVMLRGLTQFHAIKHGWSLRDV